MIFVLIILYAITLIYFVLSERVAKFIVLLSIQGFLLFFIALNNLIHIQLFGLVLILLETIGVKAIAIPWFLTKIRKTNKLNRVHESAVPVFYSIIIITLLLVSSFLVSNIFHCRTIQIKFLSVALASVFGGIYFIIIHKNIFSHLVGYLIIENGIFLLSLAVGNEMPFMVSLAVLLDVLIGILVIGIFLNKVGDTFSDISVNSLSKLKD